MIEEIIFHIRRCRPLAAVAGSGSKRHTVYRGSERSTKVTTPSRRRTNCARPDFGLLLKGCDLHFLRYIAAMVIRIKKPVWVSGLFLVGLSLGLAVH